MPDDATVVIVGWPDVTAGALRRRGDIEVLIAEGGGDGHILARRLAEAGGDVTVIPDRGIGAAAVVADMVLIEALAAGPSGVLAAPGSHAAAAVADAGRGGGVGGRPRRSGAARAAVAGAAGAFRRRRASRGNGPVSWCRPIWCRGRRPGRVVSDPVEGLAAATCPAAAELFRDAG